LDLLTVINRGWGHGLFNQPQAGKLLLCPPSLKVPALVSSQARAVGISGESLYKRLFFRSDDPRLAACIFKQAEF
jgi:hypothetical protein